MNMNMRRKFLTLSLMTSVLSATMPFGIAHAGVNVSFGVSASCPTQCSTHPQPVCKPVCKPVVCKPVCVSEPEREEVMCVKKRRPEVVCFKRGYRKQRYTRPKVYYTQYEDYNDYSSDYEEDDYALETTTYRYVPRPAARERSTTVVVQPVVRPVVRQVQQHWAPQLFSGLFGAINAMSEYDNC